MAGFDIETLLRFTPCDGLCARCMALLAVGANEMVRCPACGATYKTAPDGVLPATFFAQHGLLIDHSRLIEHAATLATIAHAMRESLNAPYPIYPPMRALLEALASARDFVHFTTFGISALLLGALKLAALRVDVRGVVSGVKNDGLLRELTDYEAESPRLDLRLVQNDAVFPHQKIVIIDGLLAFKGSANMTDFGWRKAASGREVIDVVTDIAQVADLNNRFFSPVWAAQADNAEAAPTAPAAYAPTRTR